MREACETCYHDRFQLLVPEVYAIVTFSRGDPYETLDAGVVRTGPDHSGCYVSRGSRDNDHCGVRYVTADAMCYAVSATPDS